MTDGGDMDTTKLVLLIILIGLTIAQIVLIITSILNRKKEDIEDEIDENEELLKEIREMLSIGFTNSARANSEELERLRGTVNQQLGEGLDKRITYSFAQIDQRLAKLHQGVGELQSIAGDVGELRKVMSNVKNRGTFGEMQLSNILRDILPDGEIMEQFNVDDNTSEKVDFAVKIIGMEKEDFVYLPIDSKLPKESYLKFIEIRESGTVDDLTKAREVFGKVLMNEAKSIGTKYVKPPTTTDFAIMFLPFESIYGEALEIGCVDKAFEEYRVIITGPSNLASLISCVAVGARNMAVAKNAAYVMESLRKISAEFSKYQQELEKAYKQLNTAQGTVEKLLTTRTRAMERVLGELEKGSYEEEIL